MARFDLSDRIRGDVVLHSTPCVAKFQQTLLWADYGRSFQFVPTQVFGLVMVTAPEWEQGQKIKAGWILWRPHSLMLSWLLEKRVNMVDIDLESAVACYYKDIKLWFTLGKATREFPQYVVPR